MNKSSFRTIYHRFCIVPLTERTAQCIESFPDAEKANAFLAYGYIDHTAGLTLEVLAGAKKENGEIEVFEPTMEIMSKVRAGAVELDSVQVVPDENGTLAKVHADKVTLVNQYYAAEESVENTRAWGFLDSCRDETYIDDVLVYLVKEGNGPEGCWVRIAGLGDHCFLGNLLNEPCQDFNCHVGDQIAFIAEEQDGQVICVSDRNLHS